jgi:hypothetical protein
LRRGIDLALRSHKNTSANDGSTGSLQQIT